ncbi:MAG: hypothetical protein FWD26_04945 [Treponema sp.]|nr:hypothetical protein [Treponema sp.]
MHLDEFGIDAIGIFMNEEAWLNLRFRNDRFYSTSIRFVNKSNLFEMYNKITDLLEEKYGKPSFTSRDRSFWLKKTWEFNNNCNIITYFIPEINSLTFRYENNTIFKEK